MFQATNGSIVEVDGQEIEIQIRGLALAEMSTALRTLAELLGIDRQCWKGLTSRSTPRNTPVKDRANAGTKSGTEIAGLTQQYNAAPADTDVPMHISLDEGTMSALGILPDIYNEWTLTQLHQGDHKKPNRLDLPSALPRSHVLFESKLRQHAVVFMDLIGVTPTTLMWVTCVLPVTI